MKQEANSNGYTPFQKSRQGAVRNMERYDNLSPEQRAVFREAPFNLGLVEGANMHPFWITETIRFYLKDATLKTYGPTHPSLIKETQ